MDDTFVQLPRYLPGLTFLRVRGQKFQYDQIFRIERHDLLQGGSGQIAVTGIQLRTAEDHQRRNVLRVNLQSIFEQTQRLVEPPHPSVQIRQRRKDARARIQLVLAPEIDDLFFEIEPGVDHRQHLAGNSVLIYLNAEPAV